MNGEILKNVINIHAQFLISADAEPVNDEPLNTFQTLELLFPFFLAKSDYS